MKTIYAIAGNLVCVGFIGGSAVAFSQGHDCLSLVFVAIGVIGLDYWADYRARHNIP